MCTEDSKLDTFEVKVSNVIPFDQARPNAGFIDFDDENRPMFLYSVDYKLDGSRFGVDLWAYSVDDAQKRIAAIKRSAEYSGQIYERQLV